MARRRLCSPVVLLLLLATPLSFASAGDEIDVDLWHRQLAEAIGPEPEEAAEGVPGLGLFPYLGAAAGPPNWLSGQVGAYLSYSDGRTFSLYGGYSYEAGPQADAHVITLGWGGVRPLHSAAPQLGFHGKYLRYRRWADEDHGTHHGLSVGHETGLGNLAMSVEMGAARSQRNHWLITLQVCLKFATPVHIPLGKASRQPGEG
jgi:hypothetical protein